MKKVLASLSGLLLAFALAVPVFAQTYQSAPATATLSLTVPEVLSVTVSPATILFTYNSANGTASANSALTVSSAWNVASTRTGLYTEVFVQGSTNALVGPSNIPASEVFAAFGAASPYACTATTGFDGTSQDCTPNGANITSNGFSSSGSNSNYTGNSNAGNVPFNGSGSFPITFSLANLPALQPGSYTGTVTVELEVQ